MTIGEIETVFLEQMPGFYAKDEIKAISCLAVQHVCNITKSYFMLHKSKDLLLTEETALIRILDELRFGKPIQYVLGETEFFGFPLKVTASVLIPRPETEELVDWTIDSIKHDNIACDTILDIGTGSGCIPIAIKKNMPLSNVYAMDISNSALDIAEQNCVLNGVEVTLFQGDILNEMFVPPHPTFDIIVSNPPYITHSEKKEMIENVLQHEPHGALFVPDDNPMLFYRSIAKFTKRHLSEGGYLFLEVNEGYASETIALLEENEFNSELRKDLQGKDRMIKACKRKF